MMVAASVMAVVGLVLRLGVVRRRLTTQDLMRRLAPYRAKGATTPSGDGPAGVRGMPKAALGWFQTPADAVERVAADALKRHSSLAAISRLVVRSNLHVSPAEVLGATGVVSAATFVGALVTGAPASIALLAGTSVGAVPLVGVAVSASRRRRRFVAGLPDLMRLLAGTLRAGFPLSQAVASASAELDGPMGEEMRRVARESSLGRPLPDALVSLGDRMGSEDIAWVGMAIEIQQQSGGNLADVLDQVARSVTDRQRLDREVRALTAEGRLSAIVLGILPPALAVVIAVVNPAYVSVLFTTPNGRAMSVAAVVGMVAGFVWMSRIVQVDH
jgi:tight adherence protein B